MSKRDTTTAIVDSILKLAVGSTVLAGALVIPNLLIALEKPLKMFTNKMNKRQREREVRRTITYMKSRGLLRGDYEHGLVITKKARKRLDRLRLSELVVDKPKIWDHSWRLVMYDIPEKSKSGRDALTNRLRSLGFYQLQRSVWIHPSPCRSVIETLASAYGVEKYVTYIETYHIDNQKLLQSKFNLV